MAGLSSSKLKVVRTLVETTPDAVIRSLELALSAEGGNGPLSAVRAMVETEAADRYVRNAVFSPIRPMFGPSSSRLRFPPRMLSFMWRGLKALAPTDVRSAVSQCGPWDSDLHSPPILDKLCAMAAEQLALAEQPDFVTAAQICEAAVGAFGKAELINCLNLSPMVRIAMVRLNDWVARMTPEHTVSVRLAYRDAVAVAPDAGPRFFEMLAAGLPEPWLILRVISAVMDKPAESYLATTELATFGERTLISIDHNVEHVRHFKPEGGASAGRAAGVAVQHGLTQILEFEAAIELSRQGLWGGRLNKLRDNLAQSTERCLTNGETAVLAALPVENSRLSGLAAKGAPRLTRDPDPVAVVRAVAYLAFCKEVRSIAGHGGFATIRNRVLDNINKRIDFYVDYLLSIVRDNEDDVERRRLAAA